MSIVSLADAGTPTVTLQEFREVTKKNNIVVPEGEDEKAYLLLLNSFDAVVEHVCSLPDYEDPRLEATPLEGGSRSYTRPAADKNPLNAWSHTFDFKAKSPGAAYGRLAGRSIAVKDNVSVAGVPLTAGTFAKLLSPSGEYPISTIDAPVVSRVLEAGALMKGTATCENFSMFALSITSATGPVHNPHMKGYATGGSSSGCSALLGIRDALELKNNTSEELGEGVDLAIGGDQGGSIRLPAAYAGIYGLKPTHGLVPYTGICPLYPMLDVCGPMARSVRDTALLLSVMAGYDGIDPRMTPESPLVEHVKDYAGILDSWVASKEAREEWTPTKSAIGMRIGILKEGWEVAGLNAEVATIVRQAAERFREAGATVEEVSVPLHKEGAAIWTVATRASIPQWAGNNPLPLLGHPLSSFAPLPPSQELYKLLGHLNPAAVNVFFNATHMNDKYGASATGKAHMHVHQLRAAYDAALKKYDVLVTPVNPTPGMRHPKESDGVMPRVLKAVGSTANTCSFNVSGHPAISIPAGWAKVEDGEGKLPVGMQIVGRRWDEEMVFKAAMAWEVGGKGLER